MYDTPRMVALNLFTLGARYLHMFQRMRLVAVALVALGFSLGCGGGGGGGANVAPNTNKVETAHGEVLGAKKK